MVPAVASGVECEATFGDFSERNRIPDLLFVKQRRQSALRNTFQKEFEVRLKRGRRNRIGALNVLLGRDHAECGVLAGLEVKFAARIQANYPQILGQVLAFHDPSAVELFVRTVHCRASSNLIASLSSNLMHLVAVWSHFAAILVAI
jgi:hypothetical protein